ncbi:hypothetical protein Nepgr_005581 [Nepenthes gracilis]|uniref:Uncharacterized protein n=1 Tax=Nepenthes gracilis TaxID=150966 RepID=A0AAD3S3E7_NEPGR|nr:hypothetical protein Nepgr_005581 [Nepenthes gracilis]
MSQRLAMKVQEWLSFFLGTRLPFILSLRGERLSFHQACTCQNRISNSMREINGFNCTTEVTVCSIGKISSHLLSIEGLFRMIPSAISLEIAPCSSFASCLRNPAYILVPFLYSFGIFVVGHLQICRFRRDVSIGYQDEWLLSSPSVFPKYCSFTISN